MKKILLLTITVCLLGFTGCVTTISTSIKSLDVAEPVRPLPLTADLNISEQKVRGEAEGKQIDKLGGGDALIRVAAMRALGQDPPRPDAADVLVGMNVYKEQAGKNMKVVVTGYPAWYHNFRTVEEGDSAWLILTAAGGESQGGGRGGLSFASPGQTNAGGPSRPQGRRSAGVGARYGVRWESRLNFFSMENSYVNIDPGFGWAVGLALKFPVSSDISVNSGVNFYTEDVGTMKPKYNDGGESSKIILSDLGISVPVFAQYTLPAGVPVYLEAGIQLGVNFYAGWEQRYGGDKDSYHDESRSAVDFGFGFGAGYSVLSNLDVGVRWIFNVNEPYDVSGNNSLSTLTVGATYSF